MRQELIKNIFSRRSQPLSSRGSRLDGQRGQETRDLKKAITEVNGRLESLCSASEDDFLKVKEKLCDIHARFTAMSELTTGILHAVSGSGINTAVTGLSHILDELKIHLEKSESGFDRISQGLEEYLATLGKVTSYLEKFRMLVLNLDILGFFTRVENAHIINSETGFSSLTNDVKSLSRRILDKSSQIQEKSHTLSALIERALADFLRYRKAHRAQAAAMLDHSVSNYRTLLARHDTAAGAAHSIASRSQEIVEKIGGIIASLQLHDIPSRQIADVRTVLHTLQESLDSETLTEAEKSGLIGEVCSLQGAKLKSSCEEVHAGIENLIKGMEAVSGHILELLEKTREVAWASGIEGLTFMEELDLGISAVIERLNENVGDQTGLTHTMSSVSSMVSEMSIFVEEIETLGQSLQLIALNARIKAARIGNEGAALDTISGSIYELSKDSRTDTNVLSHMLASIVDIAGHFNSSLAELQSGHEQNAAILVANLKNFLNAIHDMNDSVFGSLIRMNSLGECLREDIEKTVSGITIHHTVKEVQGSAIREMEEIHAGKSMRQASSFGTTIEALSRRHG